MKNFFILEDALEFIENHLGEQVAQEEIAAFCLCSLSGLQKLFSYVFKMGVAEYTAQRRMTVAARLLVETGKTATEIAFDCGFNSPEVFARAFSKAFGMPPSAFRKERRFTELMPKIKFDEEVCVKMGRKNFDKTELYEAIQAMSGTYAVCMDISHLMPINENFGRAAGDKVILECMNRIAAAAAEGMPMFRVGGDEFILMTGEADKSAAQKIANAIHLENGRPVEWEGAQIPVSMSVSLLKVGAEKSVETIGREIDEAIGKAKESKEKFYAG